MSKKRDEPACPCGTCPTNKGMRDCPATELELELLRKMRTVTLPAKLAAMTPAWLKAALAKPLPAKKVWSRSVRLPTLGANSGAIAPPVYSTFWAEGGPFAGERIEFADSPPRDDIAETATFTCSGMSGRYAVRDNLAKWIETCHNER